MKNREKWEKRTNCMTDQSGFTLVELLIGTVILSIVVASVCAFIVVGSKSYAAANTEIMLQQEAQLAMNQISDVIIDTTRSVNYAGFSEDGAVALVEKDADFTFSPTDKSLTMFNGAGKTVDDEGNPIIESGNGNQKNYQFYWNREEERLYYSEIELSDSDFPASVAEGQVVLAEYVTDFSIDLTQVEEKRVVQISMTFTSNNKTYHTSNNITIRNKVKINDMDIEELDKRVELNVRPKEPAVILEPGEDYHFSTPTVSGKNVMDKSVTWSLSTDTPPGDGDTVFMDAANGIIHISSGEMADSFEVVITTNAVDSEGNPATAKVIVYVKRAKTVNLSLDGGSQEITPGTAFTINASVEGNKLGVSCGGCTDATTEDRYVVADEYPAYGWKVITGAELVTMETGENKSATFKVNANAQDGDIIEIQAASLLSARKGYTKNGGSGIVYGTITLTVAGKEPVHLDWDGDLVYGGSNILNMVGINSDDPVFFVCVRVKKDPNAPIQDDMVMIYTTEGNNARVKPDTWLLDMNKKYWVTVQVINVLSDPSLRDANGQKNEKYYELRSALSAWSGSHTSGSYDYLRSYVEGTFWPEYTGNLNASTGGYRGGRYAEYSNLRPGTIDIPKIGIQSYLDDYVTHFDGIDAKTLYTVQRSSLEIPCHIGNVTSTWGDAVFQNQAFYNVYRGAGENSSDWERIYYLPEEDVWPHRKDQNLYQGTGNLSDILLFNQGDLTNYVNSRLKVNFSNNANNSNNYNYAAKKSVVGTYHYVPGLPYVNQPEGEYLKISDNYEIYDGKQYCYDFTSTFNFTLKDGGNLTLWAYTDDGFQKGQIFFPEPSDPLQFPSVFRDTKTNGEEASISSYDGTYLLDSAGKLHQPRFSEIRCRYIAATNAYELKIYYDYDTAWGTKKRCCAGIFRCDADGTEWRMFSKGDYDDQLAAGQTSLQIDGSNVNFAMADTNGNLQNVRAYIPLPTDPLFTQTWWGGFGFVLGKEGTQTGPVGGFSFQYQLITGGNANIQSCDCNKVTCQYDKATDTYTLELSYVCLNSGWPQQYATVKVRCKSGDNRWNVVN